MLLSEFLTEINLTCPKDIRVGQHFYNKLYLARPDLAESLVASKLDPYYNDSLLAKAIEHITINW